MPTKVLTVINGIQTLVNNDLIDLTGTNPANLVYNKTITYPSGLTAGTNITLPNGQTYQDVELEVYVNGVLLETIVDFNMIGIAPRTQIALTFSLLNDESISFRIEDITILITGYSEVYTVPSTILAGTAVTIPNGKTYNDTELDVFVNGILRKIVTDYNTFGASPPRTQVTFTENLVSGDKITFRKESNVEVVVYDETLTISAFTAAGNYITLPAAGIYYAEELEVSLNGQSLEEVLDFNFVGLTPRFQIQILIDLFPGDLLRFRKERAQG